MSLTVAVPKGRILAELLPVLTRVGIVPRRGSAMKTTGGFALRPTAATSI